MDKSHQYIAFEAPGTPGVNCELRRLGYFKRTHVPAKVMVQKSGEDLEAKCFAPGNRQITVTLEPGVAENFYANSVTLMFTGAIDALSGAMYTYPEKVVLDFTQMKPGHQAYPDYQYMLDKNPEMIAVEEFRAGWPALQRDRNISEIPLRKRQPRESFLEESPALMSADGIEADTESFDSQAAPIEESTDRATSPSNETTDSLTRRMNPGVFGGTPVIGSPADLLANPALDDPLGIKAATEAREGGSEPLTE